MAAPSYKMIGFTGTITRRPNEGHPGCFRRRYTGRFLQYLAADAQILEDTAAPFFQSRPGHLFIQVAVQMRLNTPKCVIITLDPAHHQGAFK